jgi:uncharacterized protein YgfB (UPF0149 family)
MKDSSTTSPQAASEGQTPNAKPQRERRTVPLHIRLTPTEKRTLAARADAAGADFSDYVRGLVLDTQPKRTKATGDRRALIEALAELGKIGSNVNQLARDHNRGEQVEAARLAAMLDTLEGITTAIFRELGI